MLNESEFNRLVDATLLRVEEAIDESGADIDYESAGGILTLRFSNGSQVILNRQTPVRQLWLAARSGGYHFDYDAEKNAWRGDRDGRSLSAVLSAALSEQGGTPLTLSVE